MSRAIFGVVIFPFLAIAALDARPLPSSSRSPADSILAELQTIPQPGYFGFHDAPLPPFVAKAIEAYQADYSSLEELKARLARDPSRHPLRAAVLNAAAALQRSAPAKVDVVISAPPRPSQKTAILKKQKQFGADLFYLEKALEQLHAAAIDREREPSRRWRAHYDYVLAAFQAHVVFAYEYQFMLGRFRREEMPPLVPGQTGWRLGPREKLQISEGKIVRLNKDLEERWPRIERDYPGTPWETFAQRQRISQRGLEWLPGLEAN